MLVIYCYAIITFNVAELLRCRHTLEADTTLRHYTYAAGGYAEPFTLLRHYVTPALIADAYATRHTLHCFIHVFSLYYDTIRHDKLARPPAGYDTPQPPHIIRYVTYCHECRGRRRHMAAATATAGEPRH